MVYDEDDHESRFWSLVFCSVGIAKESAILFFCFQQENFGVQWNGLEI
jgi:hypothetical protein